MDSFEFNKIAGAVLGALLLVMGLGFLAELLYAPQELAQAAYVVEIEGSEEAAEAAPAEEVSIAALLASADAENGAKDARKCAACHNFESGAANKVGPNLYGIVGRPIASVDGFSYSGSMQEHAAAAGTWSYEELDGFLKAPKKWVAGTSMAYAGVKRDNDRADLVAYLASISPDAPPFPVEEAAVSVESADDGDGAAEEMPEGAADQTEEASAPASTDAEPAEQPASTDTAPVDAATSGEAATSEPPAGADSTPAEAPTAEAAPVEEPATPAASDDGTDTSGDGSSGN